MIVKQKALILTWKKENLTNRNRKSDLYPVLRILFYLKISLYIFRTNASNSLSLVIPTNPGTSQSNSKEISEGAFPQAAKIPRMDMCSSAFFSTSARLPSK